MSFYILIAIILIVALIYILQKQSNQRYIEPVIKDGDDLVVYAGKNEDSRFNTKTREANCHNFALNKRAAAADLSHVAAAAQDRLNAAAVLQPHLAQKHFLLGIWGIEDEGKGKRLEDED